MKLIIFETHPIQYRAPVYQEMEKIISGEFKVIFASDFSVRGYLDKDFQQEFSWDIPLLSGYQYQVLNNEVGKGVHKWNGLTGKNVFKKLNEERPKAILLCSFNHLFSLTAYLAAKILGIKIWIRVETQDEAFKRSNFKKIIRSLIYRLLYTGVDKFFYIGRLNYEHYVRHGVKKIKLIPAKYCTPDPFKNLSDEKKGDIRNELRKNNNISEDYIVIAFSGKLINKKNPRILMKATELNILNELKMHGKSKNYVIVFIGSGELAEELKIEAEILARKISLRIIFLGFINQSRVNNYYLMSDILILPSLKMGETWGLVVNEALQAGCSIVLSDNVGSGADFKNLERVRIFSNSDVRELAVAIGELGNFQRDFNWSSKYLTEYSIEASGVAIANEVMKIE